MMANSGREMAWGHFLSHFMAEMAQKMVWCHDGHPGIVDSGTREPEGNVLAPNGKRRTR